MTLFYTLLSFLATCCLVYAGMAYTVYRETRAIRRQLDAEEHRLAAAQAQMEAAILQQAREHLAELEADTRKQHRRFVQLVSVRNAQQRNAHRGSRA